MGMGNLILTYDIGTTGNKCTLFDDRGKSLYACTVPYETLYPKPGWAEQRPEDFWNSVVTGTRLLLEKGGIPAARIAVVGLSGHMNGCIPVDKTGKALFHDIIHSDSRSSAECGEIAQSIDPMSYYRITGNRLDPHGTLSKVLWLKNNYAGIYKDTAFILGSKDYISFLLTGNLGVTDYSDASLEGMLDITRKCWSADIAGGVGLDMSKLPSIHRSHDIAGYISPEAAAVLGLVQGTPVVVGGGDGACAARGAGVRMQGQPYNYIGSSAWISVLTDKPILDRDARNFNYFDLDGENCNACGTVQSAAIAYDWVIENIGGLEAADAQRNGVNVYDFIDSMVQKVPIGSNGVFFLPYLMGERTPIWDENARGGFIGLSLYHSRSDLFRATYEGIAYALKSVLDVFADNGVQPDTLSLIGGGARSGMWNEILCSVYGKQLRVHKNPREATSLGAAMAAGVGIGMFKDFCTAAQMVEYEREWEPEDAKVREYDKYYKVYCRLYPSLKPVYDEIARLNS
jgi:xylulokinase